MGVDAREFPGGLLRCNPAFAYVEPPSLCPLPLAELLTLAPGNSPFFYFLKQPDAAQSRASECSAEESEQYKEE